MTDHLKKAKHDLYHSERADLEYGYLYAAQSIAHKGRPRIWLSLCCSVYRARPHCNSRKARHAQVVH
jgi:hypothetical protein